MDMLSGRRGCSRIQFALHRGMHHFISVLSSIGLSLSASSPPSTNIEAVARLPTATPCVLARIFTATFHRVATGITRVLIRHELGRFTSIAFLLRRAEAAWPCSSWNRCSWGVLLFGSPGFQPVLHGHPAWLVGAGSCLSALWIPHRELKDARPPALSWLPICLEGRQSLTSWQRRSTRSTLPRLHPRGSGARDHGRSASCRGRWYLSWQ